MISVTVPMLSKTRHHILCLTNIELAVRKLEHVNSSPVMRDKG